MNFRPWAIACVLLAGFAVSGCGKEEAVTVTDQPKDKRETSAPAPASGTAASNDITWTIPDGWKEDPTPRPMRAATLIVAEGDDGAQVIVTRLSGSFGEFADNVNRWRAQVGLDAVADASAIKPEIITTPVGEAKVLKMEGPDKTQVVAMVQRGGNTWFFRMVGGKAAVAANEAKLKGMITSLKAN